jgi:putative membrane protein
LTDVVAAVRGEGTARLRGFFGPADEAAVEAAVREAEQVTAGEIVPYAVGRSDLYASAAWKAATLGAVAMSVAAALAGELGWTWGGPLPLWIALPPAVGAALGFLCTLLPAVRRGLVTDELMELRVRQRALAAFVAEEVFRTRDRTGILIFLSLFEHRVLVLGDEGINSRVAPADWEHVVAGITAGIRAGRPGEALAEGIRACARLLASRVERTADDANELANRLRQSEE